MMSGPRPGARRIRGPHFLTKSFNSNAMLTPQQGAILALAREHGGTVTSKQVQDEFVHNYHSNGEKHLGAILSRMVAANLLVRVKKGVFTVGTGKKSKPSTPPETAPTLF